MELEASLNYFKKRRNKVQIMEEECAIYALEKQIPKKPDFADYDCSYFICPCCKNAIYSSSNVTNHKFCLECGQALDWSDENDL